MAELFGRVAILRVGDREWEGLRIAFDVRRSLRKKPNIAKSIRIYGLNVDNIGEVMTKGALVQLTAGYTSTADVIFSGQLSRAQVVRQGADLAVDITARDGGAAWQRVVSRSVNSSAALRSVVADIASDMGVTVDPATLKGITGSARGSMILRGYARDSLDVVLTAAGYEWSVQDGALQVVRAGASLQNAAVVLSPDTGLVSEPMALEKGRGWTARALMQPRIRPGRIVLLKSKRVTGAFKASVVEHAGDTHSPSRWTTTIELREV